MSKKAIIIGAGPAGLTAAYELVQRTDIQPIILEKSQDIGGICKTVNYNGNRLDIGGHRFFSKSDRVMNWWLNILPLQKGSTENLSISYQNQSRLLDTSIYPQGKNNEEDKVMLVRNRLSRIFYSRKFFNYPISFSLDTLRKLGFWKLLKIIFSYAASKIVPRKPTKTLEDFYINRFGKELYLTFFKDYTEKVWGKPCKEISAEWGAQRVKELSIGKAITDSLKRVFAIRKDNSIEQKDKHTSLIERFLYPKFGPGQLWEEVGARIQQAGGKILQGYSVIGVSHENGVITKVEALNESTGRNEIFEGDYFFSSMPVKELIKGLSPAAPPLVSTIAEGLQYRDFITVGLLLKDLRMHDSDSTGNKIIKDNWIYVQDPSVRLGRLQIYNNWSPYLVKDEKTIWIGMEYFCEEGDDLWNMPEKEFIKFAIEELERIGFAGKEDVLDATIIKMEKTYPAYFGTYDQFNSIRQFTDQFSNLFLVGRNGMHKYNNSDHSMLTAMTAVDNIINGVTGKENIWEINTEQDYHERKKA